MADEKKEKFSSIFDAVSKIERRKVVEKVLSEEATSGSTAEKPPLLTDEEIVQKLAEYEKLHNLLADSLEQAYVKSNLSPRKLREYFSTSQNFSADQWNLIERERQNIDTMIDRLIPYSHKAVEVEKTGAASEQARPKKMQVKSRWTPMR